MNNNPDNFEIKFREFDAINKRLMGVRTLIRAAYSEKRPEIKWLSRMIAALSYQSNSRKQHDNRT